MISPHADGVLVTVWVVAGASRDEIVGVHDGALKVKTAAPPREGRANRRVAAMVASLLGARRSTIVEGEASRRKTILVRGVSIESARDALERAAG